MRREVIKYLPEFLQSIREFYEIAKACDVFIEDIYKGIEEGVYEKFTSHLSEKRLSEWEKLIGIKSFGSIEERRNFLKSVLRKKRKLNEETIKSIVKAITGGEIYVDFFDSSIIVRVKNAENEAAFSEARKSLLSVLPAHLNGEIRAFGPNWNEVKNNFSSWEEIGRLSDWSELLDLSI